MRVLIVDDYPDSADMIARLVKLCGHEPQVAHDGFQAIDCAKETAPDLVLMDIQMPGMNGYDTAKRMQSVVGLTGIPIFAITAFEADPVLLKDAGMHGHYRKPVMFEQVKELLRR